MTLLSFLIPPEAVLRNVQVTLQFPRGFTHHLSETTDPGMTLPLGRLKPGERRIADWWLSVDSESDGQINESFVVTVEADETPATVVRASGDTSIPRGAVHTARSGTDWLEPGYRLAQREITPRIVIESMQNGVKHPAIGNDSATLHYNGVLDHGQRLVLDATGNSRLFLQPVVDHADAFGSFDSGYVVGSVHVNRKIDPGIPLKLEITGSAADGAQSQLVLRYQTKNGTSVDQAVLVNRFLSEIQTITDEITPPEIAVGPDGDVILEWDKSPLQTFAVSVSPMTMNELAYAGIFGRSKFHGVDYFTDDIPKRVLEILEEVASA